MIVDALLERASALHALHAALAAARSGNGSIVVISGEAGIGKSTVVRAWCAEVARTARVLTGACDDLMTARAFGPLRDAVTASGGPLEAALASCPGDAVFDALITELDRPEPTVVVVEDLHWADDATLDVLGYLARRVADLPVVLLVTIRDGEAVDGHPLRRWLGALVACPVRRVPLERLSLDAIGVLAAGSEWDPRTLLRLTGGNPFFLSEALALGESAAASGEVPASVADAVTARVLRMGPRCQSELRKLSVVPGVVDFELAERLLGDLAALAEAESREMIEVTSAGVAFRHELARRAVEASLTGLQRRLEHRAVVTALQAQPDPDLARLVHHASKAGDSDAVARYGVLAGREAASAGSHRQALAHFESAMRHADRLGMTERATLLDDFAWELHNAHRFFDALRFGTMAVDAYGEAGDVLAHGESMVRLSRYHYLAGDTNRAQSVAKDAVDVLSTQGSPSTTAYALTYYGAALALGGESQAATAALTRALALADRSGRPDLVGLCLNYQSIVDPDVDETERIEMVRRSLSMAREQEHREHIARSYTNLAELLHRLGRFDELSDCVRDGLAYTTDRGFWSHAYNLEVHRCLLQLRRGEWAEAESRLTELTTRDEDPGMLRVYGEPVLGRLLARRGMPEAERILEEAWERGRQQRSLVGLALTATGLMEWAWLNDRPDRAQAVLDDWHQHVGRPSAEPVWGELLRYAARAGLAMPSSLTIHEPGIPPAWASGVLGDWCDAASRWRAAGDPYEAALELAESCQVEPTLEALTILDGLGADAAARIVRYRLKGLGVRTIPRGPVRTTRAHPAGLTSRQADVLDLLADGLTNAEIAVRLVVSVRTVDHHVSTVLAKLGVASRRQAGRLARALNQASA